MKLWRLILTACLLSIPSFAGILYVASSGPDGDGSSKHPYSSVSSAVAAAASNGWECEVVLLPGIHTHAGTLVMPGMPS